MEENEISEMQQVETLESEIKGFADELPYWAKYLANKILAGNDISDNEINTSYSYLLEELNLKDASLRPEINIICDGGNVGNYRLDLLFDKLENVAGVNALTENQLIEFCPNVTILYGANGSGKSGYIRLLKKVFYSKVPEEIIPNIYLTRGHKPVSAEFSFRSAGSTFPLKYPEDSANEAFKQFAVFDGKSILRHLGDRNEFEFRPAGLSFFANLTEAIKKVEVKLNTEIGNKKAWFTVGDFVSLFDGESEIKTVISNLSAQTEIDYLKKYTPFSETNKAQKEEIEKRYDELLMASKNKEKEIQKLESIRKLVNDNKKTIEAINKYFTTEYLTHIETSIKDCISKEATSKAEGIENFESDRVQNVGSQEWNNFIKAAEQFAKKQKSTDFAYPETNDNCLLCHQPLSDDAQKLIISYWAFIKSVAEQNANNARSKLSAIKAGYEKLHFNLFPEENILSVWLTEQYPNTLTALKQKLAQQEELLSNITFDLTAKSANKRTQVQIVVEDHDTIISAIDESIKLLYEDEQYAELNRLLKEKTNILHKEKLNAHFSKFETYIYNQQWITEAYAISWMGEKRKITDCEKRLSGKYFSQKYIDTFNKECSELNGNFGIEINHTGSEGTSYRQLTIKGRSPTAILSEGEQKVIALADFISEMQLSEVNRGIIFDDPVTSLDEGRKKDIASRLVRESVNKQVIVFTHDLIFVSNLLTFCEEVNVSSLCHWVENRDGKAGHVWLENSPSYEKQYRNAEPAKKFYIDANKEDCPPAQREFLIKTGFTALRTCYEVLVINELFNNVVQRYNERVSIEALKNVYFDKELVNELLDSFFQCCRYMEGHTHSDKYAHIKPEPVNLNNEIQRYETIRTKIKTFKKN